METGVVAGGVVFAVLGSVVLGVGLNSLRRWLRVRAREPVTIRAAATEPGQVELEGQVEPTTDILEAPFSGTECVAYECRIERRSGNSWQIATEATDQVPFRLVDDTGVARVDPDGATLSLTSERIDDVDPDALPDDLQPVNVTGRLRYTERRLDVGATDVYVGGDAAVNPAGSDAILEIAAGDGSMPLVADVSEGALRRRLLLKGAGFATLGGVFVLIGALLIGDGAGLFVTPID